MRRCVLEVTFRGEYPGGVFEGDLRVGGGGAVMCFCDVLLGLLRVNLLVSLLLLLLLQYFQHSVRRICSVQILPAGYLAQP